MSFVESRRRISKGQTDAAQQQTVSWPAVTQVELKGFTSPSDSFIADLGLFGNLRHLKLALSLTKMDLEDLPFNTIWETWPGLEYLEVGEDAQRFWVSSHQQAVYDDAFCGVYWDESELLREQDEEYLKKVNIVSPFSPLYHHKCK